MKLTELRSQVEGTVLEQGDPQISVETAGFSLDVVHSPDVVVGASTEHDVVAAVRFARDNGLRVTVQATGHGAGVSVTSGLMITTKRLDTVIIDPATRIASIGAGAEWRQVLEAGAPHGLAGIPGASRTVGVVGYLLGGGLGPLSRSHGFSSDWVRGFQVVTADGSLVRADERENADLFWALRGGKGGFGVVTSVDFELVPLARVYGGALFFDAEHIETAFRHWIDWTATAPDDATTSAAIIRFPPFDEVPQPLRGRHVLTLRFAYPGDPIEGARIADGLRSAPVLLDTLGELSTADLGLIHNDPTEPGVSWDRGRLLASADQDLATVVLDYVGADRETPFVAVELRHLGARTRVDVPGGSAVGGRASAFTLFLLGVDPSLFDHELPTAADALLADLSPRISEETTINFAGRAPTVEQFDRSWTPPMRARLDEIRAAVDPHRLFAYGPVGG